MRNTESKLSPTEQALEATIAIATETNKAIELLMFEAGLIEDEAIRCQVYQLAVEIAEAAIKATAKIYPTRYNHLPKIPGRFRGPVRYCVSGWMQHVGYKDFTEAEAAKLEKALIKISKRKHLEVKPISFGEYSRLFFHPAALEAVIPLYQ